MSTLPAERRSGSGAGVQTETTTVTGWGGGPPCPVRRWRPADAVAVQAALRDGLAQPAIPRGMGRSYGDAAQLDHAIVIDTSSWRDLRIDEQSATATVEAGVTLGQLLAAAIPSGLILPVVPGTQHVSVGGAIASDIHGKNHGTLGTFGRHVTALGLITADGEERELHPGEPLFEATVGGMGLTGVISWARIQLRRVGSSLLAVDTDRVRDLDEALAVLSAPGGEHRVAWLDLLYGTEPRGVVTRARHLDHGPLSPADVASRPRLTVPGWTPGGLLRPSAIRVFNELRYRRTPRCQRDLPEPFGSHMFPLDGLAAWPRLYGPKGFLQYQLVVPRGAEQVLRRTLQTLRSHRVPCYLAVLKDFGAAGDGILSFPIEGWTLALDLPRVAAGLYPALDRCDELVVEAGGRVYLSKDARMGRDALESMYPRLAEWRAVREAADPERVWRSDLALRTGMLEPR